MALPTKTDLSTLIIPGEQPIQHFKIAGLFEDELAQLPDDLKDLCINLWSYEDLYKFVTPTKFGIGLKKFSESKYCKEIHVISACQNESQIPHKIEWLHKFFGKNNKVRFYPVPDEAKKSETIKEHNIEFNVYAEDRIKHIIDIATAFPKQSFGCEILIPSYGYNQPTPELTALENTLNLQIFYMNEI